RAVHTLRSKRGPEDFLDPLSVGAAEGQFRAVAQDDDMVAVEQGLDLADALDVDNGRAMDAQETLRVDTTLQGVHRLAQEMGFGTDVQTQVVARRLDPVNLLHLQKEDPPARFDDQSLQVFAPGSNVTQQRQQLPAGLGTLVAADVSLGPFEGPGEA